MFTRNTSSEAGRRIRLRDATAHLGGPASKTSRLVDISRRQLPRVDLRRRRLAGHSSALATRTHVRPSLEEIEDARPDHFVQAPCDDVRGFLNGVG